MAFVKNAQKYGSQLKSCSLKYAIKFIINQISIFCAIYFMLVPLRIVQNGWWNWLQVARQEQPLSPWRAFCHQNFANVSEPFNVELHGKNRPRQTWRRRWKCPCKGRKDRRPASGGRRASGCTWTGSKGPKVDTLIPGTGTSQIWPSENTSVGKWYKTFCFNNCQI